MTTSVQHSMQYYQVSNPQVCHCSHPLSLSLSLSPSQIFTIWTQPCKLLLSPDIESTMLTGRGIVLFYIYVLVIISILILFLSCRAFLSLKLMINSIINMVIDKGLGTRGFLLILEFCKIYRQTYCGCIFVAKATLEIAGVMTS